MSGIGESLRVLRARAEQSPRDLKAVALSQAGLVLVNVLSSVVAARALQPARFGRFIFAAILFAALHQVLTLGAVDRALRRDLVDLHEPEVAGRWLCTYYSRVWPLAVCTYGGLGWFLFGWRVGAAAAFAALGYYYLYANQVVEQATGDTVRVQICMSLCGASAALAGALAAYFWGEPGPAVAARLLFGFVGLLTLPRRPLFRVRGNRLPINVFASAPLLASGLLYLLNNQRSEVGILQAGAHAHAGGIFAAAAGSALFLNGPLDALHMSFVSRLSQAGASSHADVWTELKREARMIGWLALAVAPLAPIMYSVLYGHAYRSGIYSFAVIYVGICVKAFLQPSLSRYVVTARETVVFRVWFAALVLDLLLVSPSVVVRNENTSLAAATLALLVSSLVPAAWARLSEAKR